jgi:hypothetical protein
MLSLGAWGVYNPSLRALRPQFALRVCSVGKFIGATELFGTAASLVLASRSRLAILERKYLGDLDLF